MSASTPLPIVVIGGTGFLGSFVVPALASRYGEVWCVVRRTSDTSRLAGVGIGLVEGDLDEPESIRKALRGAGTLVTLASLGFGHAPKLLEAARGAGVSRALFVGTTSIFTSLPARSRKLRLQAEECIRSSGLAATLLRPTMIYGAPGDRNISRLLQFLARSRVVLVPGHGQALHQPVLVDDVAQAVLGALEQPEAIGRSYNLAGPDALSFNALVDTAAAALGRRVIRFHVPLRSVLLLVRLGRLAGLRRLPSPEQVLRLNEDRVFDLAAARRDLGYDPLPFEVGVALLARRMGLAPAAPASGRAVASRQEARVGGDDG